MPKRARLNGIKALKCYTIEEAGEATGVTARTIQNWISDGLPVMDAARPKLIRGDDLRDHIKSQRSERKVKTPLYLFYCLPCRAPRGAAGGMADCVIDGRRVMLTALCETCETVVSKTISEANIPVIAQTVELKITRR